MSAYASKLGAERYSETSSCFTIWGSFFSHSGDADALRSRCFNSFTISDIMRRRWAMSLSDCQSPFRPEESWSGLERETELEEECRFGFGGWDWFWDWEVLLVGWEVPCCCDCDCDCEWELERRRSGCGDWVFTFTWGV